MSTLHGDKTTREITRLDWEGMLEAEAKAGKQSWIIPNVLAKGCLHYLSAPPGHGKTWIICDLIRAACQGGEWLHEYDMPKTNVLYIDEEMGVCNVMDRFEKLGMRSADGLGYLNRVGIKLDSRTDVDWLLEHCKTDNVELVIIDSLVRIHDLNENDASEMRKLFVQFSRFLDAGITLFISHHTRKGGTELTVRHEAMRGSAEIAAAADMVYACEKKANGLYSLSCTKSRLIGDESALSATFEIRNVDGVTMVRTLDKSSKLEVITTDIKATVIKAIGDSPNISVNALQKIIGIRASTLRDALASLEKEHLVTVEIGARHAKLYTLSCLI